MHDDIRKFYLNGETDDTDIVKTRERLVLFVENTMRDENCVPVLDLDPQFTLNYKPETEKFDFELTVYGTPLHEGNPWTVAGVMNGKTLLRYTPKDK